MTTVPPRGPLLVLPAMAGLLLAACGGGGGGGLPAPTAVLTDTEAKSELAKFEATTTQCAVGPSALALGTAVKLSSVIETARLASQDVREPLATSFSFDVAGNCTVPGKFVYDYNHASGVTDTQLDFQNYCVTGVSGDTVYNGVVKAKEVGTPTTNGPLITSHQLATVGALTIQPGDPTATLEVTLTGGRTVYGVPGDPAIASPATPTVGAPDKTTVSSIVIKETTTAGVRTHTISNLAISRSGTASSASVSITGGRYVRPDGTTVDIRTPDGLPAVVDITTGELLNGSIELRGANNSVAAIEPGTTARNFTVTVDSNAPLTDAFDCSGSTTPVETALNETLARLNIAPN